MSDLEPQTKDFRDRLGLDVYSNPISIAYVLKKTCFRLSVHTPLLECGRDYKSHHTLHQERGLNLLMRASPPVRTYNTSAAAESCKSRGDSNGKWGDSGVVFFCE